MTALCSLIHLLQHSNTDSVLIDLNKALNLRGGASSTSRPEPVHTASFLSAISSKKGFVYSPKSNPLFDTQMNSLKIGWYYSWGLSYSSTLALPFTPMIWGAPDVNRISKIPPGATELLAFNEPDGSGQSNITTAAAAAFWPQLKATGLRIGSVATAQNPLATSYTPNDGGAPLTTSYFEDLWQRLSAAGMKPDFIALHWYAPPNSKSFLAWLDNIHAKYVARRGRGAWA